MRIRCLAAALLVAARASTQEIPNEHDDIPQPLTYTLSGLIQQPAAQSVLVACPIFLATEECPVFIPRGLPIFPQLTYAQIHAARPNEYIQAHAKMLQTHAPNLQRLRIGQNSVEDELLQQFREILAGFSHHQQLRHVEWRAADTKIPEVLADFPALTELTINPERFPEGWESVCKQLAALPKLKHLHFSTLPYAETLPESFGLLADKLETLILEPRFIGAWREFPSVLRKFQRLRKLVVREAQFTELPAWISELKNLEFLEFQNVSFANISNDLCLPPKLHTLRLYQNEFEGALWPCLARSKSLKTLEIIANNRLDASVAWQISGLERLVIRHTPVNTLPSAAASAKNLKYLWFEPDNAAEIFGENPTAALHWLGDLVALRELHLRNCEISEIPAYLHQLRALEIVDLSENRLPLTTAQPSGVWPKLKTFYIGQGVFHEPQPETYVSNSPAPTFRLRETAFRTLLQN